jgi:UDP-N-acetylmuramoyl-tripeptide--D-alanyl-D-alanine ligase
VHKTMKQFSIKQLSRILDARIDYDTAREPVAIGRADLLTAVSTDSRNIKQGDCFFAIPGGKFDGHDYITEAFAKGAACVVVSREVKGAHDKPVLRVDDTIKALGDFAGYYRRESAFKVVAITGSVGKTTTRQIIYHVLGRHYRVKQSPRSFNNNIGLPLTLLDAEPDDDIVVAELGANHPGEIAYLARIAQPDIAVVTNVHPAHLEGFGDLQTIIREKLSIAEGLSPNGVLIINGDIDALVHACRVKALGFWKINRH